MPVQGTQKTSEPVTDDYVYTHKYELPEGVMDPLTNQLAHPKLVNGTAGISLTIAPGFGIRDWPEDKIRIAQQDLFIRLCELIDGVSLPIVGQAFEDVLENIDPLRKGLLKRLKPDLSVEVFGASSLADLLGKLSQELGTQDDEANASDAQADPAGAQATNG